MGRVKYYQSAFKVLRSEMMNVFLCAAYMCAWSLCKVLFEIQHWRPVNPKWRPKIQYCSSFLHCFSNSRGSFSNFSLYFSKFLFRNSPRINQLLLGFIKTFLHRLFQRSYRNPFRNPFRDSFRKTITNHFRIFFFFLRFSGKSLDVLKFLQVFLEKKNHF